MVIKKEKIISKSIIWLHVKRKGSAFNLFRFVEKRRANKNKKISCMLSFLKKKNSDIAVPEWASFFNHSEYQKFSNEVNNYFKKLNLNYQISDGVINVQENYFGFNNLGLTNVSQVCKREGPKFYKEIITEHFDSMIRAHKFDQEFKKIADNFEEVKKYIGIRLYDNEYVAHIGKELTIGKDIAGDVYAMIVFDLPDCVLNIKPEQIEPWNKTIDELFEIGKKNIKEKYLISVTKEKFGEFSIWFANSDHFFTPNIIFDLENRPELIGTEGSLVGLPHRHSAIIYPIENLEVVKAINGIIPALFGMNQEGPGALSNNLFWYKDNTFKLLPYKIEDGKLQFYPPEDFVKLLNVLKE